MNHPILHSIASIHTPRVGRDLTVMEMQLQWQQFQSTRPGWGATSNSYKNCLQKNISTDKSVNSSP